MKNYTLCGGTALAIQLGHRISEDLDFMTWRVSKEEKPEVDWPNIEQEIQDKIGPIEHRDILGFDQVMFVVKGVKLSFFVSKYRQMPISNNSLKFRKLVSPNKNPHTRQGAF